MNEGGVDRCMLHAWLSGRSIVRGLPAPVADQGGYRIDTNTDTEVKRWVFSQVGGGLVELGHLISEPRHFLKLCGETETLRSILPVQWQLPAPNYFMRADGPHIERSVPAGYSIKTNQIGEAIEVRVKSSAGELAASGYAAETPDAFIYDRIVTTPKHRRKGLGNAVMKALQRAKRSCGKPELLVATADGRSLYETLGWRIVSALSTASIPDEACQLASSSASPVND
jgi:GNAT superfamily N-acetyltransferase